MQVVAVEDVVAEDEGARMSGEEGFADEEGLGQAIRAGLDGVGEVEAPAGCRRLAVARNGACPAAWR